MRLNKSFGLLAFAVLTLSAAAASPALASTELLTFYAGGGAIPLGPKESDAFALTTTDPVRISIPEAKLAISCPAEPEYATFGWFETNGLSADVIGTNGYATGPVRDCSGASFGGLLLDGTLHLASNDTVAMGWNELLEHSPQLQVNGCYFFGDLRGKLSLPGPLQVTLTGTMRSRESGCPAVAHVEVGPLRGFYTTSAQ